MKHMTTISQPARLPATASSLLVKQAQVSVLGNAIGAIATSIGALASLVGIATNGALSGVAFSQELSDFFTKADTHDN